MAFILKRPFEGSPGVVIFTHKERRFFENLSPGARALIDHAKRRFVFGIHWGHYAADVIPPTDIDFHLAGPGTLHFAAGHYASLIPLCSRNFAPACFVPDGGSKYWDVVMVARPLRLKHIDEFFRVWKSVLSQRPSAKALLVCPEIPDACPSGDYVEMVEDYRAIFTEDEQRSFTLLLLSPRTYPFPLSQETMAFFYNRSRFFTLFSEQEGESRVIAEALLCGLPVIVKRSLRGGGRDYLDDTNSFQFVSLEDAVDGIVSLLSGTLSLPGGPCLAKELRTDFTANLLSNEVASLFRRAGKPFAGPLDLEGLDRKLPGHVRLLPDHIRSGKTDDLRDMAAFRIFLRYLCAGADGPVPALTWTDRIWRVLAKLGQIGKTLNIASRSVRWLMMRVWP